MKGFVDFSASINTILGITIIIIFFFFYFIARPIIVISAGKINAIEKYFELIPIAKNFENAKPIYCTQNSTEVCYEKENEDLIKNYMCQQCLLKGPLSGSCFECANPPIDGFSCSSNICHFDYL